MPRTLPDATALFLYKDIMKDEENRMTYREIQADVKNRFGRSVKTCWIAHVKELNGLCPKRAANRQTVARKYPCPDWARSLIEDSMVKMDLIIEG